MISGGALFLLGSALYGAGSVGFALILSKLAGK